MPLGVYIRTTPGAFKGRHHTKETKSRISFALKGIRRSIKTEFKKGGSENGGNGIKKGSVWSEARRIAEEKRIKVKKPIIKNGKEYSSNWHDIRKKVYKRDNWFCQDCRIKCHNKVKIQCHHINYNEKDNAFSNLITLCASCHAKTNFKRKDWILYFQKKLKEI